MKPPTIYFAEKTTSTNLLLTEIVEEESLENKTLPDFFAVVTNEQTAGRGQGEKSWLSAPAQNILASFYFEPNLLPNQQIYFNYFFALTIRKLLSIYLDAVTIKKPNDVYVKDKKIAGILIEHHIQGEHLKYTIAGVGININQAVFEESLPNPTSLKLLTGKEFNRGILLGELVQIGKKYYELLQNQEFIILEAEYEKFIRKTEAIN